MSVLAGGVGVGLGAVAHSRPLVVLAYLIPAGVLVALVGAIRRLVGGPARPLRLRRVVWAVVGAAVALLALGAIAEFAGA